MRNILVTGAAGGIGSTLSLHLVKSGHNVIAYDNLNNGYENNLKENGAFFCRFVLGDIRDTSFLSKTLDDNNIDTIIHMAAITALPECESNPSNCISVNVGGTASVFDAARKSGQHVIVASTSAIYENNTKDQAPFREDLVVYPRLIYPSSKLFMEGLVSSYITNYGMDITTLRFFNVFGPRQDIHRKSPPLVNYIVRQIKNRETINLFSDGTQLRDYVHVDDVVRMIDICLDGNKSKGGVYNVCSETLTSVHDIIGFAKKAFGQIPEVIFNKPKNFWQNYDSIHQGKNHLLQHVIENEVNKYSLGSCKKAEDVLGWKPNRDIESLMVETMRENYIII